MKINTIFVTAFLLIAISGNAAVDFKTFDNPRFPIHLNDVEPISFIERGIAFYIFPDGQFDFNTEPSRGEMYFKNGRRIGNTTYGAPRNFAGGVRIEHDNDGKIRRIGNVFINYDFNNRIRRIGTVYMSYNRFALTQVGGLRIIYNRFGQVVDFVGSVKGRWNNFDSGVNNYYPSENENGNGNFNNNGNGQQNDDHYYYKKAEEKELQENKAPRNDNRGDRR